VPEYFTPISKRVRNLIYVKDGTVWANYLLRGINTNPYNPTKITACQEDNEALFAALSQVSASDFLLLGVKVRTPPDEIIKRCTVFPPNVPKYSRNDYPELNNQYSELVRQIESGKYAEYQRVYWLSIALPTPKSWYEKILSDVAVVDPHRRVNSRAVKELEQSYYDAIPAQFMPVRTSPDHVRWIFDRVRLRGISVPSLPDPDDHQKRRGADGPRSFPEVMVSKNGDVESLLPALAEQINEGNPDVIDRGKRVLRENFRSLRWSKTMAVHNVETRSEAFPNGYTSYQSSMAIARWPAEERFTLNTFTYLVDQEIGVDADFALRFSFDQDIVGSQAFSKTTRELAAEDMSNSRDRFESARYGDRQAEVDMMHEAVRQESAPRGMEVTAVFTFAHQNKKFLERRVAALYNHFTNNDITPIHPVGGQYDTWMSMFPGVATPGVIDDLKQRTTARLFSGFMPVRRTFVGDAIGIPIAVNIENALGQIVHYDILNATDKGNASIAVDGAQGAGKSMFMKNLFGYMIDLNRYVHVVDQTEHGEYAVFAQALTDTEVIDVVDGWVSMDVLKCFPADTAAKLFSDLYLPLLGIPEDSPQAQMLSAFLRPEYRELRGITSTRKLIDHINHIHDDAAKLLQEKLAFWSQMPYTRTFIDPVINGEVVDLEPFSSKSKFVVFRTHKLTVYHGDRIEEADPSQRYANMVYTAIALMTANRFRDIKGPCVFGGDEMAFLKGSRVLETLIKTPDRTGRKNGNFVIAGAQLAKDFDENYDLIKRVVTLRQETRENAIDALAKGGVPTTERMITKMLEDTSPPDPERNNFARLGREGEGWYNDGNFNIARIRTLPPLRAERFRYADTTSSRMLRIGELGVQPPKSAQEAMDRQRAAHEARMRTLRRASEVDDRPPSPQPVRGNGQPQEPSPTVGPGSPPPVDPTQVPARPQGARPPVQSPAPTEPRRSAPPAEGSHRMPPPPATDAGPHQTVSGGGAVLPPKQKNPAPERRRGGLRGRS
jgi:hypothetical protein